MTSSNVFYLSEQQSKTQRFSLYNELLDICAINRLLKSAELINTSLLYLIIPEMQQQQLDFMCRQTGSMSDTKKETHGLSHTSLLIFVFLELCALLSLPFSLKLKSIWTLGQKKRAT